MGTTALGYPYTGGTEAAAFTRAQWKELERQAMIYKYMVASVPVPPHLLSSDFPATPSLGNHGCTSSIFNLNFGNNKDLEAGRCKRTDGKKWRCSRDVAPHQRYCERHMHRGRPRSRKPVEQKQLSPTTTNKKTRLLPTASAASSTAPPPPPPLLDNNPVLKNVTQTEDISLSLLQHHSNRGLEWMTESKMKTCEEQWHELMSEEYSSFYRQNNYGEEEEQLSLLGEIGNSNYMFVNPYNNNNNPNSGPCSLNLSMSMAVSDSQRSWMGSAPGGPLAELFNVADNSNGDAVISPATGTVLSLSDTSTAAPEIVRFKWLN